VQDEPVAAGTYFKVGTARTAAAGDNSVFEVVPCTPQRVVVIVVVTSSNGTAAATAAAAMTYVAPEAGAVNSGDAGTDTVIISLRTQLIALAADVTAIRTGHNALAAEAEKIGDDVRARATATASPAQIKSLAA
jgi:hypothetical protein